MKDKKMIIMLMAVVVGFGVIWAGISLTDYDMEYSYKHEYESVDSYDVQNGIDEEDIINIYRDGYLLIYDEASELSRKNKDNIVRVLEYAKKNIEVKEVKEYKEISEETTNVIICTELLDSIRNIDNIFRYARDGGSLMFAVRPNDDEVYEKYEQDMGIKNNRGFVDEAGIKLKTNLLIGASGFELDSDSIQNSALDIDLRDDTIVHATTINDTPLIWETDYGLGKIVCVNGTFFSDKISRGVAINTIGAMKQNFIYPIINAKTVFIDDFPGPVPNLQMKELYPQLNVNVRQFYEEVWWPDMVKVADEYGFKYTGLFIQSYRDNVVGPFAAQDEVVRECFNRFAPELVEQGGEVGYHGINHQPYTYSEEEAGTEGYNAWKTEKDVMESWQELDEYMHDIFPQYEFETYVPPSNMLSAEIRKEFPRIAPSVKTISSLYVTAGDLGVYEQEFEVAEDGIVEFPRISSGYANDDSVKWNIYNGITMHGVFSHFIHPDDILDKERSAGHDWGEMLEIYKKSLDETIAKYPWINIMTASEAGETLKSYEKAKVYIDEKEDAINVYINDFREDMYFIIRTPRKVEKVLNGESMWIDDNTYVIHAASPQFSIVMKK